MKIVLLRHGRPELDLIERKHERITASEIKKFSDDYRWISLAKEQIIPDDVIALGAQCEVCVTSDTARSIESAQHIVGENIFKSDSIYREAELPHPMWRWPKLSIRFWLYFSHGLWMLGYKQNGESIQEAKQNARLGAEQLVKFTEIHNSVLLVGHGINIHLIGRELKKLGWSGSTDFRKEYWSYNQFILE